MGQAQESQTIFLLEDDRAISDLLRCILQSAGYGILEASNGTEAIRICRLHRNAVDLLLCDVVLQDERVDSVVARFREFCPGVRVLFLSGFPLEDLFQRGLLEPRTIYDDSAHFLQKPFSAGALMHAVQNLLPHEAGLTAANWG